MSGDQFGSVEGGRLGGWILHHPSAYLDQGSQLPGLGSPNALQALEVHRMPTGESGYRAGLGDELGGESKHRVSLNAAVQEQSDQFGVAERCRAVGFKPLLRHLAAGDTGCPVLTVEVKRGLFHVAMRPLRNPSGPQPDSRDPVKPAAVEP